MADKQLDGGWRVRGSAPPPVSRPGAGRVPDPEIESVLDAALESGEWLAKTYESQREAHLAGRRIRYAASQRHGVRVQIQRRGVELSVKATQRQQERNAS